MSNTTLLFGGSRRPIGTLVRLVFVLTDRLTLPQPVPLPTELRDMTDLIWQRYDAIVVLRRIPLFTRKDSPTRSLYRMYELVASDQSNQLMQEVQYFWNRSASSWRVQSISDPRDESVERYAILASLVESLVLAFNWRYSLGFRRGREADTSAKLVAEGNLEKSPAWTASVVPLVHELRLYEADPYLEFLGEIPRTSPFAQRNIIANAGNIFSI